MFREQRRSGERGAIVIHVAIALIALLAFSAFIIDQGLMYVSRRQAQNSADAGALAGALAMLFDGGSVGNPTPVVVAARGAQRARIGRAAAAARARWLTRALSSADTSPKVPASPGTRKIGS